jgi:hypothetical protein
MEFATGLGAFVLSVLAFIFCVFLFMGFVWAVMMFMGVIMSLLFLPCELLSLLIEFLLVRHTTLDGGGLKGTQLALVTIVTAGTTAGIAAACGAALPAVLIFAGVGAFYGLLSGVSASLGRRFYQKPRR